MSRFIKGMDLSTLLELERCGAKYYDHGKERDILDIMRDYDVDTVRLRLWNDPYSETGEPYGAGCNDLAETIAIGKKVSDAGFGVLLNFHYSDFWADPGKQIKPKAWKDFDADQLEQAVYEFTGDSLCKVLEAGVNVTMIQVGNEVTNGLLWPEGLKPNYDNIARFISSGIRACRAVKPEIPLMIHLDNGGNNEMYRDWFDHYMERGEDFDYIGLSYYPFWHGIPPLIDINGEHFAGITEYPKMSHGDIADVDVTKVAAFIKDMTGIGILVPDDGLEDYIRQVGHLPERTTDDRTIDQRRKQQAEQNQPPEPETAAGSDENGEGEEIPDNVVEAAKRRLGRSGANGNKVHTAKANTQGKDTGQSRSPTQT